MAIRPGAFLANVRAATEFEVKRRLSQLGQPVDKAEWRMSPPTVNAYFDPTANNINFPAGILQPPFFDFSLDDAVNYGAIGAVIGHEISHSFDDAGALFDSTGLMRNWWTPNDFVEFKKHAKALSDQPPMEVFTKANLPSGDGAPAPPIPYEQKYLDKWKSEYNLGG